MIAGKMSEELREMERALFKREESRKNGMAAIRDLEQTKERLLTFAEYAKDAQPEVLTLLALSNDLSYLALKIESVTENPDADGML